MKKIICSTLIFTLALTAVFSQSMKATVVSTSGKVERQVGEDWIPIFTGDTLNAGTMISTGFKSSCTVKFDNSIIELQPLSRLTLSELLDNEGSRDSSVYLDAGKITANIKSSDNKRVNFTVNSPVATASVRGTAGTVDCLGRVESTESTWSVQAVDHTGKPVSKPVPVSKGMQTVVSATTGTVKPPVQATISENLGSSSLMAPASAPVETNFAPQSFASDTIKQVSEPEPASPTVVTTSLTINVSFGD